MKKVQNLMHSDSCLGGDFKDFHAGTNALYVTSCGNKVEVCRVGQIHLSDDRDIGAIEDGGIFQRLVFTLSRRKQDEAQLLAEIIAGGTDKVCHIFDEEEIDRIEAPRLKRRLDHLRIKVADRSRCDLPDVWCRAL